MTRLLCSLAAMLIALTMKPGVRYTGLRWDLQKAFIRKRDGYKCRQCGVGAIYGQNWLECAHRRRVADGGGYSPFNLRMLCKICHDVETTAQKAVDIS